MSEEKKIYGLGGDTIIDVSTNDTVKPQGIKIKDLVGTSGFVNCWNVDNNKESYVRYHDVRLLEKNAEVVEMRLLSRVKYLPDDPALLRLDYVVCSPQHLFLVYIHPDVKEYYPKQDIEWAQAQHIEKGVKFVTSKYISCEMDSVCPIQPQDIYTLEVDDVPGSILPNFSAEGLIVSHSSIF